MDAFIKLQGIAAPLPQNDIDTDIIYPGIFLRTIQRHGLKKYLFHRLRFNEDGSEKPDFVLNTQPYKNARILITGKNFGCGSSREHAPWALLDFGIRCIIAPSFADIFYNNCFKNGILPVILPEEQVNALMKEAQDSPDSLLDIDLEKQTVTRGNKFSFEFQIDPSRKESLLKGLDEIGQTLEQENAIAAFEAQDKHKRSWI